MFIYWRQDLVPSQQCVLFILFNHNLDDTAMYLSPSATAIEPNPEEGNQLANDHTDGTGDKASNDSKEGGDDKEAEGLVE